MKSLAVCLLGVAAARGRQQFLERLELDLAGVVPRD